MQAKAKSKAEPKAEPKGKAKSKAKAKAKPMLALQDWTNFEGSDQPETIKESQKPDESESSGRSKKMILECGKARSSSVGQ